LNTDPDQRWIVNC